MKFTFKEWSFIKHCIEVAARDFTKQMESSKPSEDEHSIYQIFKKQSEQANELVKRIENADI